MHLGCLYIVSSPIGNLSDMTLRACEILSQVSLILAEDTRCCNKLLSRHNISAQRVIAFHEHNERGKLHFVISSLQEGKDVALLSDAGTPLISDPGFVLVREAVKHNIQVIPLPGPCSVTAALSASGLPTDRFIFLGFLPPKKVQRKQVLNQWAQFSETMIFFEAPHRLLQTLKDISEVLGEDREMVVARELTKRYESIYRDTSSNLHHFFLEHTEQCKGEIVLLIQGYVNKVCMEEQGAKRLLEILNAELAPALTCKLAAKITGLPKQQLYRVLNDLSSDQKNEK